MKFSALILAVAMLLTACGFTASADYSGEEISAVGAVVIDALTGEVLYEKDCDLQLPMASTTKIMSALIALEQDNLYEEFTVDSEAIKVEGSSMGLQENDRVTLRTLVYGMLLPSGNDAANAVAVRVAGSIEGFVDMMNQKGEELGLKSTHFVTPSGLDDYTDEHYSTAYDMAVLTREALKNQDFLEICSSKNAKVAFGNPPYERWLVNSNKLLSMCDGVIGVKTGFTDKARRCLVSACERDGATLICVTLNDPDDWNDHSKLYDYCFSLMEKQTLPTTADSLKISVVGGKQEEVLCTTDPVSVMLPSGKAKEVSCRIYLPPFVYAPVAEGVTVGRADYYYNGEKIAEYPIYTVQSVKQYKTQKAQKQSLKKYFDRLRLAFLS